MAEITPNPAPKMPGDDKNVFTELFNAKQSGSQENAILDAAAKGNADEQKTAMFLKRTPTDFLKKSYRTVVMRPKSGSLLLRVSALLLVIVGVFFYTQNNSTMALFSNNPAQTEIAAEELVQVLKAEIFVQKHLAAVLELERFTSISDAYFYNLEQAESEFNSGNQQDEYDEKAEEAKPELIALIASIQENLADELNERDVARSGAVIDGFIQERSQKTGANESVLIQDIQDLESTRNLIQNSEFKTYLKGLNAEELEDEQIADIVQKYSRVNRNVLTVMAEIKNLKKPWRKHFDEIEAIVKSVDPLFNTEFPGNISVQGINFNQNGTITINGGSQTEDSKNFTVVSNLVDALEASPTFQNVSQRNFNKSLAGEGSYKGGFNLTLELTPKQNE